MQLTNYAASCLRITISIIFLLILLPVSGFAADGATLANQGNGRGAMPCVTCHGVDGNGQEAAGFPRLAGLNAVYLRHQLDSYAENTRSHPIMTPIASALNEVERQVLADYYSTLPVLGAVKALSPIILPESEQDNLGAWLALRGRWEKQVPACVQCHGPQGIGVGTHFPPLAGQSAKYLADQLYAWQKGVRHNDALGLMKHIAEALTDDDIQAVSAWFAAQPVVVEGEAK